MAAHMRWEVRARRPFAGGAPFRSLGPLELITGRVRYRVAVDDPRNRGIVDLPLAPAREDGLVEFSGDYTLIAPTEAPARKLLIDVPNRGRPLALAMLNGAPREAGGQHEAGDGLLFRCGFAVASIGWQWDAVDGHGLAAPTARTGGAPGGAPIEGDVVCRIQPAADRSFVFFGQLGDVAYPPLLGGGPAARLFERDDDAAPLRELPRQSWRFAREQDGRLRPSARCIHKDGGFQKGRVYVLVYRARDPRVAGCGLLALRDAADSLRRGDGPNGAPFEHVLAFGASQTGRVLRHLLHLGLNVGADGAPVFDGMHIHIAGAQRGDFNHRFAQPSSAGVPAAGQRFPFAGVTLRDPLSGDRGGLYAAAAAAGVMPKVVATNTSFEYWRGDAALAHVAPDGARDLPEHPDERSYLFAGTHHVGAVWPPTRALPQTGEQARHPFNTVDHAPLTRAAFANLDAWVVDDIRPPSSEVPTLADGTLTTRAAVLAKFAAAGVAGLDAKRLGGLSLLDLGPDVDAGVCDLPAREGAPYARLVAAVDETLNEVAGVRLPDIAEPIGCHTGWNPRHPAHGAPDLPAIFVGFSRFANSLPRRAEYERRVRACAHRLVAARHVLAQDEARVVAACLARYDHVAQAQQAQQAQQADG